MNLMDPLLGAVTAPEDATPEEINAALTPMRQQAQSRQMMMQGLGALGRTVATAFSPAQEYPQVSPVAAMAMGPNYQSFREGQIAAIDRRQQAEQFAQRNALAEQQLQQQHRMQTQELLQREQDNAARLRLQKMMHDNRLEAQRQRDQAAQERAEQAAREKAEAAERKERQGTLRSTPGGGTAHMMWDDATGSYIANEIIPGRQPVGRGGGGGGESGKVIGRTSDGYEIRQLPGGKMGRFQDGVFLGIFNQNESAQGLEAQQKQWDSLYQSQMTKAFNDPLMSQDEFNAQFIEWYGPRPTAPPTQEVGIHSGYGSTGPRSRPNPSPETVQIENQYGIRPMEFEGGVVVEFAGTPVKFDSWEEYDEYMKLYSSPK